MKKTGHAELPESLQRSSELTQEMVAPTLSIIEEQRRFNESVAPIIEQTEIVNELVEKVQPQLLPMIENPVKELVEPARKDAFLYGLGEIALKNSIPDYIFKTPALLALENIANSYARNIASGLSALMESAALKTAQAITSSVAGWLQTIDFTPLTSILDGIKGLGFDHDYRETNKVFLGAMFDARWFPYAGWIADMSFATEVFAILRTSRDSKNRIKRIDKLMFSYYNKAELSDIKRGWRAKNLPSYMTRILIQAVQAYGRREYALTVSALSTLWEGIIQEKVNDDSYRISRRTRENLTQLINENEFDRIFASFCEEFIFYDCRKPEDVKPDVPGRHGIAHCWWNQYPNRKVALNAILFTDFLLELKPLERTEETDNG